MHALEGIREGNEVPASKCLEVTQMVHDLKEQVVSQRFEDLRQKMVKVAWAAPSCHQPQQAV
ncbi:hypothetical protein KIN20_009599 [Parelaphostrongylus tenuis]|uniref:Uncharacterized protein n=1 Tax=Parelaphostrongylus tenuis TaxID=148309 RepID=A0AAD5QIC4_PARTN|nr:hypothetical protein KIN20_009599 [Parelaphostrongylus tenuis]